MEGLCFTELSLYTKYRPFGQFLDHGMHVDVHLLPRLFGVGNNYEEQPLRTEKAWNSVKANLSYVDNDTLTIGTEWCLSSGGRGSKISLPCLST